MFHSPIAQRELLVLAKSPAIYRTRVRISFLLLLVGAGFAAVYQWTRPGAAAGLLGFFGWILLVYSLFIGAQATSDAISREKREGTLGLLFLTELKPGEILLGKLFSNTLLLFYGLLLPFPLLSLILIAGGIRGVDIAKLFLAAFSSVYLSASAGLFCSSIGREHRRTAGCATWMMLFLWFVPPFARHWLSTNGYPSWSVNIVDFFNPGAMFDSGALMPPGFIGKYFVSLSGTLLLGTLFLLLAWYYLPRRWQEKGARPSAGRWHAWKDKISFGSGENRTRLRRALLEANPFYWLCSRDRLRLITGWIGMGVLLGIMGFFWWAAYRADAFVPALVACAALLTVMQKIAVCHGGSGRLIVEHEQGTLEMLLSTPFKPGDLLHGQWLALVRQWRGPFLVLLIIQIAAIGAILMPDSLGGRRPPQGMLLIAGLFVLLHAVDLVTLPRLALWGVVISKNPKQAPQTAFFAGVLLVPLVILVGAGLYSLVKIYFRLDSFWTPTFPQMVIAYFVGAFALNIFWLWFIERAFPARLREFATRRYIRPETVPWWQKLYRKPLGPKPSSPASAS